jgi:hypothetical protein
MKMVKKNISRNRLIWLLFSGLLVSMMVSCDEGNEIMGNMDEMYSITINSPGTDDKHIGHMLDISVDVSSPMGMTIHHVQVQIVKKDEETVIYSNPSDPHVHVEEGPYQFTDRFELTQANGVEGHTDWIMQVKAWGHDGDENATISTVEFHVHPN